MSPTPPHHHPSDDRARERIERAARERGLDVAGGSLWRTSSRWCFGVEHGDYNGTDLFGVGTDRFVWVAARPNGTSRTRAFSVDFAHDGVVEFAPGHVPPPGDASVSSSWARFPFGVDWILRREGLAPDRGLDLIVAGDIPGGGMSRSAALTLNLLFTTAMHHGIALEPGWRAVDLAQAVENDYVLSPCGQLDQTMICFARQGFGTLCRPRERAIELVPLGGGAPDFRLLALDTGTVRHGLGTSTYAVRRSECEECVALANGTLDRWREPRIEHLADVRDPALLARLDAELRPRHPDLLDRLHYVHHAQRRFEDLVRAWRAGDVATVGAVFRQDGLELRDRYRISGPELETMCDLVRTVPGVFGERMLGGGDVGSAGAIVAASAVDDVRRAVATGYPRSRPALADRFAVHALATVDGVARLA